MHTLGFDDVNGVSFKQVTVAWRKLAIQNHPDKGGDPEKMKLINQAYQNVQEFQVRDHAICVLWRGLTLAWLKCYAWLLAVLFAVLISVAIADCWYAVCSAVCSAVCLLCYMLAVMHLQHLLSSK